MFSAKFATNGTVKDLSVVSGSPLLVGAAMNAVKQWTFRPAYLSGLAVDMLTDVTIPFRLE